VTRRALIGSTGFVGGNLQRQMAFDDGFHSRNIDSLAGGRYALLVCAGAPAEKWRANQAPEADQASLARLTGALEQVQADRVVLISTVDVYPSPIAVDEATPIDPTGGQPYGRHRLALERFVQARFQSTVLRLPGLYGPGIKKNVIFDLLHGKPIDGLAPDSTHQYYDLARLGRDLETALARGLSLVNLATEPVTVRDIAARGFGLDLPARPDRPVVHYDMRTRHAPAFGGRGDYLEGGDAVLSGIRAFAESQGWRRP
jgi:nucleoside-diphosphate-sugar epimerase